MTIIGNTTITSKQEDGTLLCARYFVIVQNVQIRFPTARTKLVSVLGIFRVPNGTMERYADNAPITTFGTFLFLSYHYFLLFHSQRLYFVASLLTPPHVWGN